MQINVVPPDSFISVNGAGVHLEGFKWDSSIEAIRYDSKHRQGMIQRHGAPGEPFTDPTIVVPYVRAWIAAKKKHLGDYVADAQMRIDEAEKGVA